MAEEVAININVSGNTDKAVNSLQNLQKELKKAKSEALNGDGKAAERVAELQEKMDNLRDSVGTLKGSGIERTENSFRLLGEGFKTLDMEKIKVGFKGIGAAMSAIPLLLIVEGFQHLIEHFDEIVEWFKELIGSSNKFTRELEELKKANEDVVKSIDAQITALTGLKANEEEIIKLSRKKIEMKIEESKVALNAAILNQKNAEGELSLMDKLLKLTGNNTTAEVHRQSEIAKSREETKKATQELEAQLAALQGFDNVQTQKKIDNDKKAADSSKKLLEEEEKNRQARIESAIREQDEAANIMIAKFEEEEKLQEDSWNELLALQNQITTDNNKANQDRLDNNKKSREEDLAHMKAIEAAKFSIANSTVQGLTALGQIFINDQKKMEKFNKGAALAQIAVDTAKAISALTAASSANPANAATFGAAGVAQFAAGIAQILTNIAKAKQILMSGGTSTPPTLGGGGVPSQVPTGQAPVIQQPTNTSQEIDPETGEIKGKQQMQKVYVLETDITKKVKTIATIKETATFG